MNSIFTYVLLGVSLAAPVGPVNAAQLDKGIKFGFFHAWVFGVGALIADVIYMLLVYLGVIHFIETPFMQTFLWLFGFFVLTYTGIESLLASVKINRSAIEEGKERLRSSFSTGFIMSISNPLTILFWLGIYGSVLAKNATTLSSNLLIVYSLAIIAGILLWDFTMATVSSVARRLLHSNLLRFISIASSLSMICFGLYFGYEAVKILFL
ncbi:LysE family transporter [Sutcliffiella cohnii]|uniref:LysE family transporter n=1 Tax=Sutcliffiella cohnii TaxID=33932 RepID=UPI002E202F2D|nr:LysE family transporter [Sutcliffiella cohnii]MED4016763.1 LysE family transporter [Sutcliffiella cohnii]